MRQRIGMFVIWNPVKRTPKYVGVGTDQIWLKNLGNCHEKRSICASDYSRHEFQVLLSPMSTSFGPPMLNEKNSTCGQPSSSKVAQFWSYHSRIKCWRQLSHLKINKSQKGCKKQIRQQHLCLYSDGSWDTNTALNRTAFAISAQAKYKYSLLNTVGILYQDEFVSFPFS